MQHPWAVHALRSDQNYIIDIGQLYINWDDVYDEDQEDEEEQVRR